MYQTPHIFAEIPQGGFNNIFLPFFEVLNQFLEPNLSMVFHCLAIESLYTSGRKM